MIKILLVMFLGCLIFCQSSFVFVSADERKFEPFAPFDGISDRRPADSKLGVLNARQVFQFLQLSHEVLFVFLRDIRPEFEQHLALC